VVQDVSNLHFGPEVGVGNIKADASSLRPWLANVERMAEELRELKALLQGAGNCKDARFSRTSRNRAGEAVDIVMTSPPYPNEKDYTRTTRLESVLVGIYQHEAALRSLKKSPALQYAGRLQGRR